MTRDVGSSWRLTRWRGGEANGVRGPSVQGARRSVPSFLNQPGVVEPYVEHGERAQRSHGRPITWFDRLPVRSRAGFIDSCTELVTAVNAEQRLSKR